ncbi:hypothetical protein MXB_3271 [Myxobolus squamalis]|nr:hypothetical protein MXB_3271 [Myxobolus squamalis]
MLTLAICLHVSLNSFYQLSIEKLTLDNEWLEYKLKYKLNFLESEENRRKEIFFKNYAFIIKSNTKNQTFTLKMNNFGHLDKQERSELIMPYQNKRIDEDKSPLFVGTPLPYEFDWRNAGIVSPVEHQLQCCACYAFGAVGAIESQFALYTTVLPDLSKQEIVDCTWGYGNCGCYSGNPKGVYQYCMENGISTAAAYPYLNRNFQCNRNNPNSSYMLAGYTELRRGDENNLLRALYNIGPITMAIDASSDEYAFYGSGIIDFSFCSSVNLNHIVLAVGYGLPQIPYLIVKNSWGINWGMNGYFMIALFRNNMCGIATDASFPIPSSFEKQ